MPPVIPTAFPIPTPEITQTIDIAVFWDFNRNIAPAISMGQSVFLWANYNNILVYTIILMIILIIFRWMIIKVGNAGDRDSDV